MITCTHIGFPDAAHAPANCGACWPGDRQRLGDRRTAPTNLLADPDPQLAEGCETAVQRGREGIPALIADKLPAPEESTDNRGQLRPIDAMPTPARGRSPGRGRARGVVRGRSVAIM
jgi:hypothetical protein